MTTMLSDGIKVLQRAPSGKIEAVLAANQDLRAELEEEVNRTFKNDPLGQFRSAQYVTGLMNTVINRAGLRNR